MLKNSRDLESAFVRWGGLIYGYVFLRVQDRELAEDIAQDVFLKAWKSRKTFDSEKASLKTWLFAIATNEVRSCFKNSNKKTVDMDMADKIVDGRSTLTEETDKKMSVEIIFDKLKLLTEREQELILLKFKEDLSVKEVASILGLGYSAAKVAVHRAIRKLSDLCNGN